jgi:starch-binding outer membrane protein SusE/F
MKLIKIFSTLLILSLFFGCQEREIVQMADAVTGGEITAPAANKAYLLDRDKANDIAETFKWNDAEYGFTASVTYKVEAALKGNNFKNVAVLATVNNKTEAAVTVGDLNKALLDLSAEIDASNDVEIRVVCGVNPKVANYNGQTLMIKVTPYATSFPPIYMIGAALNGWDTSKAVEMPSYAPNKYSTMAKFIKNEAFRFFAQPDWGPTSYNYPWFTTVDSDLANANDGDKNFKVAAETGWYNIDVDLKNKIVVMTPVEEPQLYMIGAALQGWDTSKAVKLTFMKPGVFQVTTTFTNNEAFRFFGQKDWGPVSYNYPWFTTVDSKLANANDGDKNFKVVAPTASYKITCDLNLKVVTMVTP